MTPSPKTNDDLLYRLQNDSIERKGILHTMGFSGSIRPDENGFAAFAFVFSRYRVENCKNSVGRRIREGEACYDE